MYILYSRHARLTSHILVTVYLYYRQYTYTIDGTLRRSAALDRLVISEQQTTQLYLRGSRIKLNIGTCNFLSNISELSKQLNMQVKSQKLACSLQVILFSICFHFPKHTLIKGSRKMLLYTIWHSSYSYFSIDLVQYCLIF